MAAGSLVFTVHMLVLGWNFNLALLGKVTELKAFNEHVVNETGLQIYCRKGDEKLIVYAWKSVYIDLVDMPSDSELFVGENVSEVQAKHADFLSAWFFWSRRQQYISLPVFDNYCIGVICKNPCKFKLCERSVNYWKLLQLSIGIFLFFYATALSRNIILYYVTGITFGVVSSFLVVIFLISRITPRKLGAYTVIVFGWSMVLYFLQLAWDNMKSLLESYSNFVYGYIIATSLISFALCYRYGPFTDYRTLKLIQWTLQLFALLIIFLSSEFQEVPTVIIIIMLAVHLFPEQWTVYAQKLWRRYFPPKIKLLTEAEYIQEASVETRKALEELRSFCQSPNCNTWKIVSEIKDPLRFSKFVLGESHLSDQEMLDYDCDMGSLPSLENGSNIHDDEDIDNSNDSDLMDGNNIYMNSTQHTHTSLLCIL